jgi:hypothetical protein
MRVDVSENVFCKLVKVNEKSVVFDVYKNGKIIDTKEYFDIAKIDFDEVRKALKNKYKNL